MKPTPKKWWAYAGACACALLACVPAYAQKDPQKILVLNSFEEVSGPYHQPIRQFEKALEQIHEGAIVFRHLDLMYKGSTAEDRTGESIARLLLSRYANDPPDLVVATGPAAVDFWVAYRGSTFPDAPMIAMARESYLRQVKLETSDAAVATDFSFTQVAKDILQLFPETTHIFMVFGNTYTERLLSNEARKQLAPLYDNLRLEFSNDMALGEMQDKLAGLSEGSVVFLGIFSEDVNGIALQYNSEIAMIKAVSAVPVFGSFDSYLGKGIVGGRLVQMEQIGNTMAEVAHALLMGENSGNEWAIVDLSVPSYDWRELKTWSVDLSRLPPGSEILFKPPGFWEQYAAWIVAITIILVTQSIWLMSLLAQNRRIREAEGAHASLGRRLITAHEDERRLLARELHDDLSQRLARASIDAGIIASSPGSEVARQALESLGPELGRISKDVHDMSYRLHPSLVEDLGLTAALNAECDRQSRRTSAEIIRNFGEVPDDVPRDAILCIYRVAQEALNNAIRHAQATRIEISLYCADDWVHLEIDDDGVGFDSTGGIGGTSLGLSSMKERIALAHGTLEIQSQEGHGTRVTASVPFEVPA